MSVRRLLVIEDEPSVLVGVSDRLRSEGYAVDVAEDGEKGLEKALARRYDLIVLDVMLPGMDGFDVVRELRRRDVAAPVLMLTARTQVVDKVVALKLGADDYLTKPFDAMELVARVEALLRRAGGAASDGRDVARFGDVEADFRRARVTRAGEEVHLSAMELRLLRYLTAHPGEVLSRDRLLDEVWGYDSTSYSRTVDQHVASLRAKLEPVASHPRHIVTVHGMGYRFEG